MSKLWSYPPVHIQACHSHLSTQTKVTVQQFFLKTRFARKNCLKQCVEWSRHVSFMHLGVKISSEILNCYYIFHVKIKIRTFSVRKIQETFTNQNPKFKTWSVKPFENYIENINQNRFQIKNFFAKFCCIFFLIFLKSSFSSHFI